MKKEISHIKNENLLSMVLEDKICLEDFGDEEHITKMKEDIKAILYEYDYEHDSICDECEDKQIQKIVKYVVGYAIGGR